MMPTVTTPTDPSHMALPTERFAEAVNLIRAATLNGDLAYRLLTILAGATGANFNAAEPPAEPAE